MRGAQVCVPYSNAAKQDKTSGASLFTSPPSRGIIKAQLIQAHIFIPQPYFWRATVTSSPHSFCLALFLLFFDLLRNVLHHI